MSEKKLGLYYQLVVGSSSVFSSTNSNVIAILSKAGCVWVWVLKGSKVPFVTVRMSTMNACLLCISTCVL